MKRYHRPSEASYHWNELGFYPDDEKPSTNPYYGQRGKQILKETLFNAIALTCGTNSGAWWIQSEVKRMIGFSEAYTYHIAREYIKEHHPLELSTWEYDEDFLEEQDCAPY